MEIDENEFNFFKSNKKINENDEKYQEIVSLLKQKYNFTDENITDNKNKIIEIIYIYTYILNNKKNLSKYQFTFAENLSNNYKRQINNTYKIYENNLKIMCINLFFDNLTPLTILKNSINRTNVIDININNEKEEKKTLLLFEEIKLKYKNKIENFFKKYKEKIQKIVDQKDFQSKNSESEIKKCIEEMNDCIKKEMKNLNNEIEEIFETALKYLQCNFKLQRFAEFKDMVNNYFDSKDRKFNLLIGGGIGGISGIGGIGGVFYLGSYMLAGVSIVGGVVLGGAYYLYKRSKKSEYNKKKIEDFKKKNEEEIERAQKSIKDYIEEKIEKVKEKVKSYFDIRKENLDVFKKNNELFEKYYIDYENIMMESFGLK